MNFLQQWLTLWSLAMKLEVVKNTGSSCCSLSNPGEAFNSCSVLTGFLVASLYSSLSFLSKPALSRFLPFLSFLDDGLNRTPGVIHVLQTVCEPSRLHAYCPWTVEPSYSRVHIVLRIPLFFTISVMGSTNKDEEIACISN